MPIVLLHGWADSFYRYIRLIDRLTAGDGPAFDVIVPSLPGFDFSDQCPAGTGEQDSVFAPLRALLLHPHRTRRPAYQRDAYWLRNSARSSIRYYNGGIGDWSAAEQSWGGGAIVGR